MNATLAQLTPLKGAHMEKMMFISLIKKMMKNDVYQLRKICLAFSYLYMNLQHI